MCLKTTDLVHRIHFLTNEWVVNTNSLAPEDILPLWVEAENTAQESGRQAAADCKSARAKPGFGTLYASGQSQGFR